VGVRRRRGNTKTEVIGGQSFTFTGTDPEVTRQLVTAHKIAQAVKPAEPSSQPARLKTMAEQGHELLERAELDRQFRSGLIPTEDYLARTGAVEDYLRAQGFDVRRAAEKQFESWWAEATEEFKRGVGSDWPGGEKNKTQLGMTLAALGLVNATDKVAALAAAYAKMKKQDTIFSVAPSAEQLVKDTEKTSPQEILESWKQN
jgi:hypothetical protein